MRHKKKVLNAIFGVGILSVFTIGGVFSYLTDNNITTNVVTVGDVIVDLVVNVDEPWYDFSGTFISPDKDIKIETYAVNSGDSDFVVFMEVIMPTNDSMNYVSDTGVPIKRADREVFGFLDLDKDNWIFIENRFYKNSKWDTAADSSNADNVGYIFGYNEKVTAGNKTKPLFKGLSTPNFTEKWIWTWLFLPVTVRVYAIQSESIEGTDNIDVDNINELDLGYILNTYTNQNYTISVNGWHNDADTNGKIKVDGTSRN